MGDAEQISEIKSSLRRIEDLQAKVLIIVAGNDLNEDDKGLIGRVETNSKRITALEKFKERAVWWGMGFTAAGFGVWKIIELLTK